MKMILLIDLDDTLLANDMDIFIPAYLQKLGEYLANLHDPRKLIEQLLTATQSMLTNTDPSSTLKERFDRDFYPVLGLDYDEAASHISDFYNNEFPKLESVTQNIPSAVELIKDSISNGYKIVIATNPLFPRIAITQRLKWAGLGDFIDEFEIITSYENFHFTKPNPAYYAEIIAQLGWPEEPIIMIGNDQELDIKAANNMGIATYWVNPNTNVIHPNILDGQPASAEGDLSHVTEFLQNSPVEYFKSQFKSPDSIKAILLSTPAAIKSLLSQELGTKDIEFKDIESWGICEILCHLRDVDLEINIPRIKQILEKEDQFIAAVEADSWAIDREYNKQDPKQALTDFISARKELLSYISEFDEKSWQRTARHSIFGPTTMKELLQITARHDRLHIQQFFGQLHNMH